MTATSTAEADPATLETVVAGQPDLPRVMPLKVAPHRQIDRNERGHLRDLTGRHGVLHPACEDLPHERTGGQIARLLTCSPCTERHPR